MSCGKVGSNGTKCRNILQLWQSLVCFNKFARTLIPIVWKVVIDTSPALELHELENLLWIPGFILLVQGFALHDTVRISFAHELICLPT